MKKLLLFLILSSCTYSVNLVHTTGSAEDVIDDTETPTVTTTLPVSAL